MTKPKASSEARDFLLRMRGKNPKVFVGEKVQITVALEEIVLRAYDAGRNEAGPKSLFEGIFGRSNEH